jgi:hypothetical protein
MASNHNEKKTAYDNNKDKIKGYIKSQRKEQKPNGFHLLLNRNGAISSSDSLDAPVPLLAGSAAEGVNFTVTYADECDNCPAGKIDCWPTDGSAANGVTCVS